VNLTYGNVGDAYAFESVTVADAAIGCTSATYSVSGQRGPVAALISVETAELRFRVDGSNPTAAVGHVLQPGESVVLTGPNIQSLKMIRTGSTSATVRVTYFR
jgi:hypothetical protein